MRQLFAIAFGLALAGCATVPPAAQPGGVLDPIAREFVVQTLEIGERDPGFVDAYYGPPELQAAAKARPRSVAELKAASAALLTRLDALPPSSGLERERRENLRGLIVAAHTRLRMLSGEKLPFVEEARGLFGVAPELKPLASYDPMLAKIDALVPGTGTLADRVQAYEDRFNIPADRLRPVMDAAIAECRTRTLRHIALPANERFDLSFVTGKSWSGYNYYQGDAKSRIEINTDLPVRISRAVDFGCHEGYPGHHVYNALLEQNLTRGRGWIEFSVYPLYSPQSFVAEGSANYGIELAFPGEEQAAFEARVLYPLAGFDPREAQRFSALRVAKQGLKLAGLTIAADYLDGKIDRETAIGLNQKYSLESRARAAKSVDFVDQYRTYVINYGLGLDLVRAYVDAAGPREEARWARMRAILSEPTTPDDLLKR
mgnify:CR=1 FL=1